MGRVSVEAGLVLAVVAVVLLVTDRIDADEPFEVHIALALLAAATGTVASGFGHTAGRMLGNRRAIWLIPALALYSVDVVPDTALVRGYGQELSRPSLGLLVDCLVIALLLVIAIRPPGRLGAGTAWSVAVGGALVGLAIEETGRRVPSVAEDLTSPAALNMAVLLVWCVISTAVFVAGVQSLSPPLWRIGLGFGVVAAAHVVRVIDSQSEGMTVAFSLLRLLGVVVVMLGMAQLLRRTLDTVITERFAREEEVRLSGVAAERIVEVEREREHELRNGLAGLTGLAHLLGADPEDEQGRRARSAAVTELRRLTDLLDRRHRPDPACLYSADEVLQNLAVLWRAQGLDVEVTAPHGLTAVGRPSDLSQVLTSLLVNCARHAPGSPVRIVGTAMNGTIVIEVRDEGPALPTGGRPLSDTAGEGIGLQLCQRLLAQSGGDLKVHRPDPRRPGFTVSVLLAAAPSTAVRLVPPVPSPRLAFDVRMAE
jgi:two-component system OmpR family sensor kinase